MAARGSAGLTSDQIRQRVRGGHWRTLEAGAYVRGGAPDEGLDDFTRARVAHVQRCVAAVRRRPDSVIGYGSAALVHALPLAWGIPEPAQLIVPSGAWTGLRNGVRSGRRSPHAEESGAPGSPLPVMQQELRDEHGLIGRVDFSWPQAHLVGEADGRLKYDTRQAVYAEKRREDRLRMRGYGVIRWGWTEQWRSSGRAKGRRQVGAAPSCRCVD